MYNTDYINFYEEYFGDRKRSIELISKSYSFSEAVRNENLELLAPRRIVNNIARLITLGDILYREKKGLYGAQIFYWFTCIEAISFIPTEQSEIDKLKLFKRFFRENVNDEDKRTLIKCFSPTIPKILGNQTFSVEKIASILYAIRNNLCHEGSYIFSFGKEDDPIINIPYSNNDFSITVSITYEQTRKIIIRTCLNYLQNKINNLEKT